MSQRIYMDNCVTSPLAPEVFEAMKPYFSEQFWFPGTFVSTGEATNSAIEGFRKTVADALNAQSSEITFTSGGTLANNIALKGLTLANSDKGRHIIVSVVDYPDLLTNAAYFESMGFELSYLEPDTEGMVSADKLKAALRPDTILFMSTMVNHVVGTIQPIAEYSQVLAAADHKIWFHVDATGLWQIASGRQSPQCGYPQRQRSQASRSSGDRGSLCEERSQTQPLSSWREAL
jgi:cysteine desulfurase